MEVHLGKLAEQKATNDAVRKFGERMATDHEKAGQELRRLVSSKGITAPSKSEEKDKAARGAAVEKTHLKMIRQIQKQVARQ